MHPLETHPGVILSLKTQPGRAKDREHEILAVAATHLNTMGVSVEWFTEIASSLGLTRPALYKYFSDREDLQFRCYAQSCDALEARLDAAMRDASEPADILSAFLGGGVVRAPETAVMSEIQALPPDKRDIIRSRQRALVAALAEQISRGIKAKSFRAVDPSVVAEAVLGMASWPPLYSRWGIGADLKLIVEGSTELLFRGLSADRSIGPKKLGRLVATKSESPNVFDRPAIEAAKREGVLIAASALFNHRGIGATRVEDVGEAIGLSKRAIYHHVGQKQALVDACVERAYTYFLAIVDACENRTETRLDTISAAVRDVVLAASDPGVSMLMPYVGYGQLSPEQRIAVGCYAKLLTQGYRRMLGQGIAEGSIRPVPVDAIITSLPGMFSWTSNPPDQDYAGRENVADELAGLVARGILA